MVEADNRGDGTRLNRGARGDSRKAGVGVGSRMRKTNRITKNIHFFSTVELRSKGFHEAGLIFPMD